MRDPLGRKADDRQFNIEPDPDEGASRVCKKCGSELRLHQPDPQMPEVILGICGHCKAWYLFKGDFEGVEIDLEGIHGVVEPSNLVRSYSDNTKDRHP